MKNHGGNIYKFRRHLVMSLSLRQSSTPFSLLQVHNKTAMNNDIFMSNETIQIQDFNWNYHA